MVITSDLLAKFEIEVAALSSLCFLLLDVGESGRELETLQVELSRRIIFNNLTELEKETWSTAVIKHQELSSFEWYIQSAGVKDFCTGERSRNKGLSLADNPYPIQTYGHECWARGWTEQDARTTESNAYINGSEMNEWLEDVKAQLDCDEALDKAPVDVEIMITSVRDSGSEMMDADLVLFEVIKGSPSLNDIRHLIDVNSLSVCNLKYDEVKKVGSFIDFNFEFSKKQVIG